MQSIDELIKLFSELSYTEVSDRWDFLILKGKDYPNLYNDVLRILDHIEKNKWKDGLSIRLNEEDVSQDTIHEYLTFGHSIHYWQINFNKTIINTTKITAQNYTFFLSSNSFKTEIVRLSPFDFELFLYKNIPLNIIVKDLPQAFGGPYIAIVPSNSNDTIQSITPTLKLPANDKIKEQVHVISAANVVFNPDKLELTWGNLNTEFALPFLKIYSLSLSVCLVSEFYSMEKVTLRGVKNIMVPLSSVGDQDLDIDTIKKLGSIIEWIYEDRTETKIKLIADRLTLDIAPNESLLSGIRKYISDAFVQAKEQYGYIILKKKDEYNNELRDLLNDLKKQADLFSSKTRDLLSNLLRDILGALILLGFSIFTKINVDTDIEHNIFIIILFKFLAGYFAASVLLQFLLNIIDLCNSKKELNYWLNTTRNYIPKDEFQRHINKSLNQRQSTGYIIYAFISILYIILAYLCWNFISLFGHIFNNAE